MCLFDGALPFSPPSSWTPITNSRNFLDGLLLQQLDRPQHAERFLDNLSPQLRHSDISAARATLAVARPPPEQGARRLAQSPRRPC